MKCSNPYLKFMDGQIIPLPCGQCPFCRAKKSAEWALRLFFESKMYEHVAFITLTYAPEHLPKNYSLIPAHLSSFVKRLRRNLERKGVTEKIRFFGCGEYGEKRQRPHYHLMIFGLNRQDFDCVNKSWHFGIIDCQVPMNADHVNSYVAGYVTKKKLKVSYGKKRVPPFNRQSKGLGLSFVMKFPVYSPIIQKGKHIRYIGRYLKNKLAEKFGVLEEIKAKGIEEMKERASELYKEMMIKFDWFEEEFLHEPFKALRKAFPLYYEGELELLLCKQKIFVRKDL